MDEGRTEGVRVMAIRWYKTGGERYYVIDVLGHPLNPATWMSRAGSGKHHPPIPAYAVLDRDWNHREVGKFTPRPGLTSKICKRRAEAFAAELNASEKRAAA